MTSDTWLALWREANRQATEAENAFFEASMAYASGRGPMPPPDMAENAERLRERAKALFHQSLQSLQLRSPKSVAAVSEFDEARGRTVDVIRTAKDDLGKAHVGVRPPKTGDSRHG